MKRRDFIHSPLVLGALCTPNLAHCDDKWGASKGFPTGIDPRWNTATQLRVGNYSGGYETFLPYRKINAPSVSKNFLGRARNTEITYRLGLFKKNVNDFMDEHPTTGLLIWRDGNLLFEKYRFERNSKHRLTGWSMTKSVTGLLLGICVDKGLIRSVDDLVQDYAPELQGTLHGQATLRHLMNMASGAEINHSDDLRFINSLSINGGNPDVINLVKIWNKKSSNQGVVFNYNEIAPMAIGIVIRKVTGLSLSEMLENDIWNPMGAESNATWLTDRFGNEPNNAFLAASLRDWAKLGIIVAQNGMINERQIVSPGWLKELSTWRSDEKYCKYGVPLRVGNNQLMNLGYKGFLWHTNANGTRPEFKGHDGQRIIIDIESKTVIVRTGVDNQNIDQWSRDLYSIRDVVSKL
jgi:CubicO group peptidase (beta-lactamase class C family)